MDSQFIRSMKIKIYYSVKIYRQVKILLQQSFFSSSIIYSNYSNRYSYAFASLFAIL